MVTQVYDGYMRGLGLKSTQFTLLRALSFVAPVSMSGLAERLKIDRTTLTRNFKILESEGLVTVKQGSDRRTRHIDLTEEGWARFNRALPHWERAQTELKTRLGDHGLQQLHGVLDTLTAGE